MRLQTPPQLRAAPVIVDEESALPESLVIACQEAHKGGLLASSDYGNLLASMSGYEKPQSYAYDYGAATRPDQAPGLAGYGQPPYGISYTGTHAQVPSGLPNAAEIPLLSEDQYQAHDSSYAHQTASYPSFMPAGSRQLPEVTSFSPDHGQAGRKLFIYLNATEDLQAAPKASFLVIFGSRRCEADLKTLSNQSQRSNFALVVDIPPFESTGSNTTQVPLYLEMTGGNMQLMFGHYAYTDATTTAYHQSSPLDSGIRKRKMSEDPQSPSKRPSTQNLRDSPLNSSENKISPPATTVVDSYSQRPQSTPNVMSYNRTFNTPAHYTQSMQTPAYRHVGLGQPQPYNSYPSYLTADRGGAPGQGQMISSSGGSNPPLVRTTALQASPSAMPTNQPFNPYAMYPSNAKAILKLEGDLNNMGINWQSDEVAARRRIIRFSRSQNGSTIAASFEPVTLEEHARSPGHIYVNCIWWEEKQQCYITSVDTIQLLESLVAVRFTVEEKNRIRRNLEGFRPLTVSKTRPDCEEFFKIIMGFPSPKPRNIEKDVKVFPWRILSTALKKIIGKYSASYSSTASALTSPGVVAPARHQLHSSSPPSATSTTSNMTYPTSMTTTSMPTHHPNVSAGMSGLSGGLGDSRLPMHQVQQQQQQQHQQHQQQQQQPQHQQPQSVSWHQPSNNYATDLGSGSRGSWDFTQYMNTATTDASGMPYTPQRIPSISQSLGFNYIGAPHDWKDYTHRTTQA